MEPILPPIPAAPNADSTPAQWDVYLRAVGEHNRVAQIEATLKHAASQQATADAIKADTVVRGQMVLAIQQPQVTSLPTRAALVFEMVKDQPQATVLTPAVVVKGAADIVDAYVARYPSAVQP